MQTQRYSCEAFEQYAHKTGDAELRSLLQDMIQNKQHHIKLLEYRLDELGEKPSLPAQAADRYAQLKSSLTGSSEHQLPERDDRTKDILV